MKKILLILFTIALTGSLFAQQTATRARTPQALPPPVPLREISGIVKDTVDNTIIGAIVTLTSKKDTMRTTTNVNGIFIFKNVKMATFVLSVREIGYLTTTRRYLQNDAVKRLVLDPIVLKSEVKLLGEVKINGTPSIVYKVDTVEYKASDYKVRENATVDELLKKMEGFEVGSDGTVTHQGTQITKAKLNGKDYAGGDVAQAIQNLPADIVEKIQVVDDYGDQAARTGIKDGDPQKVLNITTRADRSVGTTGRAIGQYGNDDRYNGQIFVQHINANEQLGFIGRVANTVNGVASTGVAGGATNGGGGGSGVGTGARGSSSPGTTQTIIPTISYRDQWGKKIQVVASYAFRYTNNNSTNTSYGLNENTFGPQEFHDYGTSSSVSKTHNLNFEMDYSIDSANYLQITPSLSYSSALSSSNSLNNDLDFYTDTVYKPKLQLPPGFSHPVSNSINYSPSNTPNYSAIVFYQHIFKKPRRNVSIQVSVTRSNSQSNSDKYNDTKYYKDTTENFTPRDSISHLLTNRTSINTTYRTSVTYVEPLSILSQIEFNGQVRSSIYNNKATTDTVITDPVTQTDQIKDITYRDNIYDYSFTETRLTLNYRFNGTKYNFSLGATAVPSNLSGTKENSGTTANISTTRNDFKLIPVFRFGYAWSQTERFTLTYSGANTEPSFQEIQPFTDISNPNNPVVGNPNLRPSFSNSVTAQYNNYIANSKLNFSFNVNGTFTDDQIVQNNILIPQKFYDAINKDSVNHTITQTNYVNLNGTHAYVGRYNIAKQLDDRKYNLSLNGNVTYGYSVAMSNGTEYHNTNWRFDERFGPRIDPTEWFEINPYIGYDLSRNFTSLTNSNSNVNPNTEVKTTSLAVDGRMYFFQTFQLNYSATKSYVNGIQNLNTNPLVINVGFEQEFFKKRNLVLTFNAFDLLHQNNFIQQTISVNGGYTNTLSNSLSRYFLVGLRLNLQKWSGSPKRNGKALQRRGDGSFIY